MLVIDCGNTRVKLACAEDDRLQQAQAYAYDDPALPSALQRLACEHPVRRCLRLASVTDDQRNRLVMQPFREAGFECWRAGPPRSDVRLKLGYRPVDDLGVDRWLSLRALRARLNSGFVLACSGTALTVDVVDASGQHLGGTIAPSAERAREALLARAPHLASSDAELKLLAQRTTDAVYSGALIAAAALIEKLHREAERQLAATLPLYLTGGGAGALLPSIETPLHLVDHLVLQGLAALAPGDSLRLI